MWSYKPATRDSQVDLSRYEHIFLILWMFHMTALHFMGACFAKLRFSCSHEPRYLVTFALTTFSSITLISDVLYFLICCLLPRNINLVFYHSFIQVPTLIRHDSISLTDLCSSVTSPARKTFWNEWSSANPLMLIAFGIQFTNVLEYAFNRLGPVHDPWGTLTFNSFEVEKTSPMLTLKVLMIDNFGTNLMPYLQLQNVCVELLMEPCDQQYQKLYWDLLWPVL